MDSICLGFIAAVAGCQTSPRAPATTSAPLSTAAPNAAAVDDADDARAPATAKSFVAFESGPVRPVALSPDGTRLFVTNVPAGRLEIFAVTAAGLRHRGSVPVGLEPVAVAARSDCEVWVVNHLSDSVSVVDVGAATPHVVRTLLVGDEPRDVVFAGPGRGRAFITTAHRGQQRSDPSLALANVPGAGDPQLTTPGVPRADVWVFDAARPGGGVGGTPLAIVALFGDTPRALAVSPDGATVYAAVFKSGNQTTTIASGIDGPIPGPTTNHQGKPAPQVGLIVKLDPTSGHWRDVLGRNWDAAVRFSLPDEDVFAIDARTLAPTRAFAHVGTTLFNMAANPRTGTLYVSNLESRNDVRFEGPGNFGHSTVQGHLAEARIAVISDGQVSSRHLNKHIDYDIRPAPPGTADKSLSTPLDLAVSRDGTTLYVAAFGSSKIGVFDTGALETDAFDPRVDHASYLDVSGGGPAGLALDETLHRLYVYTRFDNGVSIVDLERHQESAHLHMFNPEPAKVRRGRRMLYDARATSSNGEASCASCHIFGDNDDLAWDLGNPDDDVRTNPIPILLEQAIPGFEPPINGSGNPTEFHPMKGPMTTQTLRGMVNHGAMHWRGDRANGFFGVDTRTAPPFDSDLAFRNFIVAFAGLLGRATPPSDQEMQRFSDFALLLTMPPNPIRNLDGTLTAAQARGRSFFLGCDGVDSISGAPPASDCATQPPAPGQGHFADGAPVAGIGFTCQGCHTLDPARGFFGTSGMASFEALPQIFKIPQLRNLYTKIGMFGIAPNGFSDDGDNGFTGDQIRGFGFLNDGSIDTLFRFVAARVFDAHAGGRVGFTGADSVGQRRDVEQFLLAFDSDVAPIVGQQVTLTRHNAATVAARIDLLRARAGQPFASQILGAQMHECDLIAHAVVAGEPLGWLYRPDDASWEPDDGSRSISDGELRRLAATAGQEVTYSCVPPGEGVWMRRR
jgi:YVTN family beta-propeller protein